jgi:hypothetical protein
MVYLGFRARLTVHDPNVTYEGCLGSFSDYTVLEELEINEFNFFTGGNFLAPVRLPISLRVLYVQGNVYTMCHALHGLKWLPRLAEHNHANKGSLELVYVDGGSGTSSEYHEWMEVQTACATLGLEVKIWKHRHNPNVTLQQYLGNSPEEVP